MDFYKAVAWVNENEAVIKGYIAKYRNFSPYDECDYMQEAFESAFIAATRCNEKKIKFEAAFWKVFRSQISVITPAPDILTHGSNSIPSHVCSEFLPDVADYCSKGIREKPDIEVIFQSVRHHLTIKEQMVLYWALGIGMEGKMTNYEIAELLGCVVSNVRDILNRALGRIKSLVENGSINPQHFV